MIRKDQLPNIWGDDFKAGTSSLQTTVAATDKPCKIVLHDKESRNLLHLNSDSGYTPKEDEHDNLSFILEEGAELELYRIQLKKCVRATNLEVIMKAGVSPRLSL